MPITWLAARRVSLSVLSVAGLAAGLVAVASAGRGASSPPPALPDRSGLPERADVPDAHESAGGNHKLLLRSEDRPALERLEQLGVVKRRIDYGSLRLVVVDDRAMAALGEPALRDATLRDDFDLVAVNRWVIDTRHGEPKDLPYDRLAAPGRSERQLYLVQFVGPAKDEWLADLKREIDTDVITYLPNNAYAVFASPAAWQRISRQAGHPATPVQWAAPYHPAYRISAHLEAPIARNDASVDVVVQFVEHPSVGRGIADLKSRASALLMEDVSLDGLRDVRVRIPAALIPSLAARSDVLWIEPYLPKRLLDEVQGQILAGQLDTVGAAPLTPGYLAWLASKGFSSRFPFAVDVTDDGFDRGATDDVHQDFLDASGSSRIAYVLNYTDDTNGDSAGGHGSVNAGIVGGYNDAQGDPAYEDAGGYQYGLGVAPFALLGSSKIFGNDGSFTSTGFPGLIAAAYARGARISSNSWGNVGFGSSWYNSDARTYDILVRDSVQGTAGHQEMSIVFSAGNGGPESYTVHSPGTGKNVLTVGASENVRQTGTDGCGIPNAGANDARDMLFFSSRGPAFDGRKKPDIMAPGTHVQGPASRSAVYQGFGVCNPYWPIGQTLYTWSSGTSHSAPAVAGAAALTREWFSGRGWGTPSPAMIKAFLMSTAFYLTGTGAGDTLPSNAQGYGRLDLGRALDGAASLQLDQTRVFGATGETYMVSGSVATNGLPFRVMLAWTDAPGPLLGSPWVNNLDLEVTLNGVLYRGNVFSGSHSIAGGTADRRNNTEAVFLPAGTTGDFSITVRATGINGDGVPGNGDATDQDFALFVYNGSQGAPPPEFAASVSPETMFASQGASADATLTVESVNGFAGSVSFSVDGLPEGATASFSPESVGVSAGGSASATLTVSASATTPNGTYPLRIISTSGGLTRVANASLVVQLAQSADGVLTYHKPGHFIIPDYETTGLISFIPVPASMTIRTVSVIVGAIHDRPTDLEVSLIAPDATSVLLRNGSNASLHHFFNNYELSARAAQPLAAFQGRNTQGIWRLKIRDLAPGTEGYLSFWTVSFNGYHTASPALAIPDNDATGVSSTIHVDSPGTLDLLSVRVNIAHPFRGNLEVSLIGPDGTTVLLHNREGWFLDDIDKPYPNLYFDGSEFNPLRGKPMAGDWTLKVRDLAAYSVGTFNSWAIDCRAPFVFVP